MESESRVRFYQVDAFTDRPFRGSPAGVFLTDHALEPRAMQILAREVHLSETAFVGPEDDLGRRSIRWFTPTVEISTCGHATLAAAHVLLEEGRAEGPVNFVSIDGEDVVVHHQADRLSISFRADPPEIALPPSGLLSALGCHEAVPVLRSQRVWVVRLTWQREVENIAPDTVGLLKVDVGDGVQGVAVTAPGREGADFVSRFFAPWVGVPEDPVAGVAHTALAPYWSAQLERNDLLARQLSARQGEVYVSIEGDRVRLSGEAVTVGRGEFDLPRT